MARRGEEHDASAPDESAAPTAAAAGRMDDADAARLHAETRQSLTDAARALAESEVRLKATGRALRDRESALTRSGEMARALAERTEELRARTARAAELARRLPAPAIDDDGQEASDAADVDRERSEGGPG